MLHRLLVGSGASRRFLESDTLSVFQGDYREYFRPALAYKDLSLAVDLGRKNGVLLEVSAPVEQIHRRALAQYGDAGQLFAVRPLEDLTQISLPTQSVRVSAQASRRYRGRLVPTEGHLVPLPFRVVGRPRVPRAAARAVETLEWSVRR